jgi:hypothetical protein
MKPQNNSNLTELKNVVNRLYYVSYDSQFLGTVAARTIPEAIRKALGKFGRHIIKDTSLLEVVDSGKYE